MYALHTRRGHEPIDGIDEDPLEGGVAHLVGVETGEADYGLWD